MSVFIMLRPLLVELTIWRLNLMLLTNQARIQP